MELAEARIEATVGRDMPWEPVTIYPFGDIHAGGGGHEDLFKRDLATMMADPNGYAVGMGDYLDLMSPSNRREIRAAKLYDSTLNALDDIGDRYVTHLLRLMKGTEGRWLGFLEGHHFIEMSDGLTTDMKLAEGLGAQFLGSCAFIRLSFSKRRAHRRTCTLWVHHGAGSGVRVSSPLNKIENIMHVFDADIYLMAHQHKLVSAKLNQIYMTRKRPYELGHRQRIAACTGGYFRGYMLESKVGRVPRGSYAERGMLPPTALGCIRVQITPLERNLKLEVTL